MAFLKRVTATVRNATCSERTFDIVVAISTQLIMFSAVYGHMDVYALDAEKLHEHFNRIHNLFILGCMFVAFLFAYTVLISLTDTPKPSVWILARLTVQWLGTMLLQMGTYALLRLYISFAWMNVSDVPIPWVVNIMFLAPLAFSIGLILVLSQWPLDKISSSDDS